MEKSIEDIKKITIEKNQMINDTIEKIKNIPFKSQWFKKQFENIQVTEYYGTDYYQHEHSKAIFALELETYILNKELCKEDIELSIELFYRNFYKMIITMEDVFAISNTKNSGVKINRKYGTTTFVNSNKNSFVFKEKKCIEMDINDRLPFCGEYTYQKYLIG